MLHKEHFNGLSIFLYGETFKTSVIGYRNMQFHTLNTKVIATTEHELSKI